MGSKVLQRSGKGLSGDETVHMACPLLLSVDGQTNKRPVCRCLIVSPGFLLLSMQCLEAETNSRANCNYVWFAEINADY